MLAEHVRRELVLSSRCLGSLLLAHGLLLAIRRQPLAAASGYHINVLNMFFVSLQKQRRKQGTKL